MDIRTYQQGALQTEKPFPTRKRFEHSAIGVLTELGEFASLVKRVAIYNKDIDSARKEGEVVPRAGMFEELGDSNWYIATGFDVCGQEMRPVAYPISFQEGSSQSDRLLKLAFAFGAIVGRLCELVLNTDLENDDDARVQFGQGLGQLLYLNGMTANLLGSDLETLFVANNQKLLSGEKARYGNKGYSDQAAEARADKDGVDHTAS